MGFIPNRFPDSGEAPEYNTIDATLWMFHAIDRYVTASGDWSLLDELFLTLSDIIRLGTLKAPSILSALTLLMVCCMAVLSGVCLSASQSGDCRLADPLVAQRGTDARMLEKVTSPYSLHWGCVHSAQMTHRTAPTIMEISNNAMVRITVEPCAQWLIGPYVDVALHIEACQPILLWGPGSVLDPHKKRGRAHKAGAVRDG